MPRFFIDKTQITDHTITLFKEEAAHIASSLRMTVGEKLTLCDGEGLDYDAEILSVSREAVVLSIVNAQHGLARKMLQ